MDISVTHGDERIRVQVSGDVDEKGAAEMKRQFEQLNLVGIREAVFNLRDVTYIGSAGLGKLLLFYKKLSRNNAVMRVENPSDMIRDILYELKLDSLFAIA